MTAKVFRNDEKAYLDWLVSNPEGFVLTTSNAAPARYMSLHRAKCTMISKYMRNMEPGAFTERGYFKVCSANPEELRAWLVLKGGRDFTTLCSRCKPEVKSSPRAYADSASFDDLVDASRKDTRAQRDARFQKAPTRPSYIVVPTVVFQRNPDVVAAVLERAEGFCERCKRPAPFKRRSDSTPYLEVHHRIRLADGGEDTVSNAIALCPNCHRHMHYGKADG